MASSPAAVAAGRWLELGRGGAAHSAAVTWAEALGVGAGGGASGGAGVGGTGLAAPARGRRARQGRRRHRGDGRVTPAAPPPGFRRSGLRDVR